MGNAVKRSDWIKYDGNGSAVIAWVEERVELGVGYSGWTITTLTESAGVVTLAASNSNYDFALNEGDFLIWETFAFQVFTAALFPLYHRDLPEPIPGTAAGITAVPALLLGANTNVVVPLSRAMADDEYDVTVDLVGNHAQLTIGTITKATDQVTVNVSAALAQLANIAQVHVVAHGTVA